MRRSIFLSFVLSGALLLPFNTWGEAIANTECANIQTSNDVLQCAKIHHAEIQISKARLKEASFGLDVAKQRPNLDLEAEGLDNKNGTFSSELSLLHTFELGGKRRARKLLAQAQQSSAETDLLAAKENVIIQTVVDLYRLRQIEHELKIVKENVHTFGLVRKQYIQTGRLTPEQDLSVSIFQIAEEENNLRSDQLMDERNQIISRLYLSTNKEFPISSKILPKQQNKWPMIQGQSLSGSDIKKLHNEVEEAKKQYQIEKSAAWPNVALGPKVGLRNGSGNDETQFGFSLSVPIPIYQTNRGGKTKALSGVKRSELKALLQSKQIMEYRTNLVKAYNNITKSIVQSRYKTAISERHEKLHKLLDKGIVPAPLIIELHREILEYYEILHEQELRAVGALWKVYALDGIILQEELQ